MIASWILYSAVIGVLISIAATLADRVCRGLRLPTRGAWLAALLFSIGWPVVTVLFPRDVPAGTTSSIAATPVIGATLERITVFANQARESTLPVSLDAVLLVAWIACSVLLFARLARDVRVLSARRAGWTNGAVDGVPIRLSHDTGPGVVGLSPMEVVFPSWALGLDTPLRSLVLRHEEEHRRAKDPYLIAFATLLVVLLPWNLGVWWQARRLRLAVELDCDARVLGAEPHPERYGLLLLTIAQRRSHGLARLITSLLEPAQHLGERITAMQSPKRPVSRIRAALFASFAAGFVALACTMNPPREPASPSAVASDRADTALIVKSDAERFVVDSTRYVLDKMRYVVDSLQYVIDQLRQADAKPVVVPITIKPDTSAARLREEYVRVRDVQPPPARTLVLSTVEPAMVAPPARQSTAPTVHIVAPPVAVSVATPRTASAPAQNAAPTRIVQTVTDAYYDYEVETPARRVPGTGTVVYPNMLKAAGIQGNVIASFVVDTLGRVDMSTFKVLRSSHDLFSVSVRNAVPATRYEPAKLSSGQVVKQVVQQEFTFQIQP